MLSEVEMATATLSIPTSVLECLGIEYIDLVRRRCVLCSLVLSLLVVLGRRIVSLGGVQHQRRRLRVLRGPLI
jgi:hypothetical protein